MLPCHRRRGAPLSWSPGYTVHTIITVINGGIGGRSPTATLMNIHELDFHQTAFWACRSSVWLRMMFVRWTCMFAFKATDRHNTFSWQRSENKTWLGHQEPSRPQALRCNLELHRCRCDLIPGGHERVIHGKQMEREVWRSHQCWRVNTL